MEKRAKKKSSGTDHPMSFRELVALACERPTANIPEFMRSYVGWNGLVFESLEDQDKPRIGLTEIARQPGLAAWAMPVSHEYKLGLPVLSVDILPKVRELSLKKAALTLHAVHQDWNVRNYHPAIAPSHRTWHRDAEGRRVVATAPDAVIFNGDDRRVIFPQGYPWHCVGRIESEAGTPMGSAALVGRDLVLTARHCLQRTAFTMIKFVPAFFDGYSTLGCTFFSWVKSVTHYEGSEEGAWDFALLRLYQPVGDSLGFFGVRTYNDSWDDLPVWTNVGYPSMSPFDNLRPSHLAGIEINDSSSSGSALELISDNQDSSRGNSGGPLWAIWQPGPYIVGVNSCIRETDYGPFGTDLMVVNAGGKAMVDLVGVARLEIDTDIHVKPPNINMGG